MGKLIRLKLHIARITARLRTLHVIKLLPPITKRLRLITKRVEQPVNMAEIIPSSPLRAARKASLLLDGTTGDTGSQLRQSTLFMSRTRQDMPIRLISSCCIRQTLTAARCLRKFQARFRDHSTRGLPTLTRHAAWLEQALSATTRCAVAYSGGASR